MARRRRCTPPASCRGSSPIPTPTRSGCPTRDSRSSTRSSTSATTPSPSAPTRPGSTSSRSCEAPGLPCSRSTPTGPPATFDVLAFNLSAELVYTNVLNCIDLAGVPVRAEDRRPEHPLVVAGGHCALQPRAHGRLRRRLRDRRRRGGRRRDHRGHRRVEALAAAPPVRVCCASWPPSPGSTCPPVRRRVRRGVHPISRPGSPSPRACRQAHRRRPRRVALPEAAARPAHRGRARPAQRRDLPRLHAGLPLLPGGHDHASRARAPRGAGPHDGAVDGLRRTGYDEVALTSLSSADFSGIDGLVAGLVNEPGRHGVRQPVAAVAARRRVHRRARQPRSRRSGAPGSRSRPRAAAGGSGRCSTS